LVVLGLEAIENYHFLIPSRLFIMSRTFAEFLLENAETGNEILAVLEDIVNVVETGGTDL
tara:strand:+ start:56 stop:235 length:180 start_codon:yes stop_codon:yes gene_type:complete